MEEQQDLLAGMGELPFTGRLKESLRTGAGWARFTAICSFVTAGFSLVSNISSGNLFSAFLTAAISITISIYLLNFGNQTKKGIEHVDQNVLEDGLNNLRMYFKVLTIVLIVIVAIILLALVFGGFSSYSRINY